MNWVEDCRNAIQWGNNLRIDLFKSKNLGYLVLLAVMATITTGLILFIIDPNIKSPFDGIWSAWVTMTHVGFGDVVPVSFLGRLLAAGLILLGLVVFSLFTALVSVALIGKNLETLGGNIHLIEQETGILSDREDRVLQELARLHTRIDELENQLITRADHEQPLK